MKRKNVTEVQVMNKYRLSADTYNIILQEKQTVTGTGKSLIKREVGDVYWNNIAYFSNPRNALNYIIEIEICELWVTDLKEVVKRMDKLEKMIAGIPLDLLPENVQQ